ncbi:unnamed protein product [Hermetia illucens]|uniref:aralkylamine N-acetyltransferase n=1 Tax=Hermetia illucens TaxID=343691 RepID=A0A7R8UI88_HERIL|nr:uncharacterized protein LOC119647754 [Hermetia illucens]CAD7081042.1 unnamed protein product [Hermetia illucens]
MSEVDIRVAVPDDFQDILYGFRTYFWPHEPLSSGYKIKTASPSEEEFVMSTLHKGMSLIATDPDRGDKVVGFLTIEIFSPELLAKWDELGKDKPKDERMEAMRGIYDKLIENTNVFEMYKVDKVLWLLCLGVDQAMRGKNIGTKLVERGMSMAESLGCKVIEMDCTSVFSTRIAERTGMKSISEIAYKDYVDANGEQIFNPPAIHTHIRRFIKIHE